MNACIPSIFNIHSELYPDSKHKKFQTAIPKVNIFFNPKHSHTHPLSMESKLRMQRHQNNKAMHSGLTTVQLAIENWHFHCFFCYKKLSKIGV